MKISNFCILKFIKTFLTFIKVMLIFYAKALILIGLETNSSCLGEIVRVKFVPMLNQNQPSIQFLTQNIMDQNLDRSPLKKFEKRRG